MDLAVQQLEIPVAPPVHVRLPFLVRRTRPSDVIPLDPGTTLSPSVYALHSVQVEDVDALPSCTAGEERVVEVLAPLNDARFLSKFFEATNAKLAEGDWLYGYAETRQYRKLRFYERWPAWVAAPAYGLDFLIRRVAPKLRMTRRAYFSVTQGRNRVFSKAELLGRLVSCGFSIEAVEESEGYVYFRARKTGEPLYPTAPSWGPLFRMQRVGQGGRMIGVYKLRTMHPYAEFLQAYMHEQGGLTESGKLKDDFRITTWGRVFRKVWIDELPMLINWLRGDLKLVGVRPISRHYLSLYPEDVQARRIQYKPGLVPPFYADLPESFEQLVASEVRFMDAYDRQPVRTTLRYLARAVYNIVVKRARSQ